MRNGRQLLIAVLAEGFVTVGRSWFVSAFFRDL